MAYSHSFGAFYFTSFDRIFLKSFPLIFIVFIYMNASRLCTMALAFFILKIHTNSCIIPSSSISPRQAPVWRHRSCDAIYGLFYLRTHAYFHTHSNIYLYITNLYCSLHLWPHKHSTCLCDSGGCWVSGLLFENFPLRVVFFFNRFPFMNNIKNLFHNKLFISRIMWCIMEYRRYILYTVSSIP